MAAEAGCRSIEHASFIDEAGIEACLRKGVYIVPTFLVGAYYEEEGSKTGAQDRMIDIIKETDARYRECIQAASRAGVKVALGSDFVGWDPSITAKEFEYLVSRGGLTPVQAIYAGTSSAADLLGIEALGRILPGYTADLVVIEGNPLKDITLLRTGLRFVMKGGKVVRNDIKM
jgi:imidazolonepropionase-like amidohydrolase